MLVTDNGFRLKDETPGIFWVLKLLSKAVVVVTLLPYLFI